MNKKLNKTLLAAIAALLAAVMFFGGCSCNNTGDPSNTSDPSALNTGDPGNTGNDNTGTPSGGPDASALPPDQTPDGSFGPGNTPAPGDNTPAPGVTPVPVQNSPIPTTPPTNDTLTGTVWLECPCSVLYDLDFDGRPEQIEIKMSGRDITVSVTTGSGLKTYADHVTADRFLAAVISDFNKGDGRAELVVSTLTGNRGHRLRCLRLNAASDGFDGHTAPGWIESVTDEGIVLGRMLDVMGTWDCIAAFAFDENSFELVMTDELWTVKRTTDRWCTVSVDLLVGLYTTGLDNETTFLDPGYRVYPTSTDMERVINLTLDTGAHGYVTITIGADGRPLLSGMDMTEWFSDLTFVH